VSCSPKDIPWFVSDVLPQDFERTFDALANPDFFKKQKGDKMFDEEHQAALAMCLSRWSKITSTQNVRTECILTVPCLSRNTLLYRSLQGDTADQFGLESDHERLERNDTFVLDKSSLIRGHSRAIARFDCRTSESGPRNFQRRPELPEINQVGLFSAFCLCGRH
jgi:hypothetical protein